MSESPRFSLTTPIYYVNARPHIGHAYSTIVADAIARHKRAQGFETWFLTGTDEHGQKIERSAKLAGRSPKEFADELAAEFRKLWNRMGLSYDDFIRTTEPRHRRGVQKFFLLLKERGFIYKGTYTGQYCVYDELYVDAPPGSPCPDCGRITETVSEENYFFKLSAFERPLLELYRQNPDFIRPETRRNEVISFVRGGLKDLSISRTSFDWGIPVPGDEKHVIYVWVDALANYITALGYGSDAPEDQQRFARFWPVDLHLIGKEISRFHCVYWPAFLLAAGLPLPKAVVAHGWLLFEQSKMSKSRGNIIRTETILDTLGADALRYFLLREIVFGQDGNISLDALVQRYNADLANGYGNLTSRTVAMIHRYFEGSVPPGEPDPRIGAAGEVATGAFLEHFQALDFSRALEALWSFVAAVDGYITEKAPWKLAASTDEASRKQLGAILYTCAEALRIITALVYPVLPDSAGKIWAQLGLGEIAKANLKDVKWGQLVPGTKLGEAGPIFPRAEKDMLERMQELEKNNTPLAPTSDAATSAPSGPAKTAPPAPTTTAHFARDEKETTPAAESKGKSDSKADSKIDSKSEPEPEAKPGLKAGSNVEGQPGPAAAASAPKPADLKPADPKTADQAAGENGKITIDDFAKVELRVGQVKVAERVKGADRLLRLEVDLGSEVRQIVAGIAEAYAPEALIGRKVVIVANLQPRKLRGLESNGMIVAASIGEKGTPVLAGFLEDVEIGARLK
jgi:methionyl-tRNA synthetase